MKDTTTETATRAATNKIERLSQKKTQSEIPRNHTKDNYGWLKCITDPTKTAAVFSMQEQIVKTK